MDTAKATRSADLKDGVGVAGLLGVFAAAYALGQSSTLSEKLSEARGASRSFT